MPARLNLPEPEKIDPESRLLYHTLALLHYYQGDAVEADSLFGRWLEDVAEHEGRGSPAFAYDEACYQAIVGNREKALQLLDLAMERGYSDPLLTRDRDLQSLHGDPRYRRS